MSIVIQAFFSTSQTSLGYQFYDSQGSLLGSRITSGIYDLPGSGGYIATAETPDNTVGVYWSGHSLTAREDLTIALKHASATSSTPLVIPSPPSGDNMGTVYVWTKSLINTVKSGIVLDFYLENHPNAPAAINELLETVESTPASMTTNISGYASINLKRTDAMTPNTKRYLVNCPELGLKKRPFVLNSGVYDLKEIVE